MDVIEQLSLVGLVPVIKVEDANDAVPLCKALADGGLPVAEITFRSDAAEEAIRRVHAELPEVILGAGITRLGSRAFYNCSNLRQISFNAEVSSFGTNVFTKCHMYAERSKGIIIRYCNSDNVRIEFTARITDG